MRQQRNQQASVPAPMRRTAANLPAIGFLLVVDGQPKRDFEARDHALKAAQELKNRFPRLQVKVYDAETRHSEEIELAAA